MTVPQPLSSSPLPNRLRTVLKLVETKDIDKSLFRICANAVAVPVFCFSSATSLMYLFAKSYPKDAHVIRFGDYVR